MLHIVSESLSEPSILQRYLDRIGSDQSLLLIEDAVFVARQGSRTDPVLESAMIRLKVFVLSEDLLVRGITLGELKPDIERVDYIGFVNLVAEHEHIQSW